MEKAMYFSMLLGIQLIFFINLVYGLHDQVNILPSQVELI